MSGSQDQSVKEFCQELQGILDTRPPISKAKMISITKAALKAIKFYKHIVMNVEKFITKCKPEYKIPGLYVIDSIIRQSRHQYGTEKDVYGSRFAKNILSTLHHVNKCPADDRNKITRVLNLWEKNAIFPSDLIRQLFEVHQFNVNTDELSAKATVTDEKSAGETSSGGKELDRFRELQETLLRASAKGDPDTTSILTEIQQITNQLLESQKKSIATSSSGDEPSSTTTSIANPIEPMQSSVANVLDDFDYGSDNDDDEPRRPTMPNLSTSFPTHNVPPPIPFLQPPPGLLMNPNPSNTVSFPITDANNMSISMSFDPTHPPPIFFQQPMPTSLSTQQQHQLSYDNTRALVHQANDVDLRPEDMDSDNPDDHRHHRHSRVSPSPSRFHYNRRRSRSPSPSRESKRARSSPNSADRRGSATSRLKEVEKRERRRKGLPPLKEQHLVVSSRTLWVGHLPKIISEIDLRETLEPHGEISDINTIPPRGCAFVCFKERSDAFRCLEKMKDFRFHGNQIKIAWAMSKGVKDRFKDYWDAEHGCTYIPYPELKDITNFSALAEGGTIDDESMPPSLKPSAPAPIQQEAPPAVHHQPSQPLIQLQPSFPRHEFQPPPQNLSHGPPPVHLDPSNRLPPGSTILMASHHEPPMHVGLPMQMMPPGAQIIQLQQHPHGQPVQVVQRITGQMFPNSQIVHQMPYGHVIRNAQPGTMIQLQHHPNDLKDLNQQAAFATNGGLHLLTRGSPVPTHHHLVGHTSGATGVPLATATFAHTVEGPSLIKFHDDPHQHAPPTHLDDRQRRPLSATDESLLRLSTSSAHFQAHPPSLAPSLLGRPASPSATHQHPQQFGNNVMQGQQQQQPHPPLLPLPVTNDEHQKQSPLPRRISRFQDRDTPTQPPDSNANYAGYRGGRPNFSDRTNPSAIARGFIPGRGAMSGGRGYNSNNISINDHNVRPELNDNNSGGFRGRGGFNRGDRGNGGGNISGDFRFSARGNPRVSSSHEHSSSHQSSRSPDRRSFPPSDKYSSATSGYSVPTSDEYSHRSLPHEALRQREKSTLEPSSSYNDAYSNSAKPSFIIDESLSSRSGHTE